MQTFSLSVALVVLCVFPTNHTIFTHPQDIIMKRYHLLQFILSNQHDKHTRSKQKSKNPYNPMK